MNYPSVMPVSFLFVPLFFLMRVPDKTANTKDTAKSHLGPRMKYKTSDATEQITLKHSKAFIKKQQKNSH